MLRTIVVMLSVFVLAQTPALAREIADADNAFRVTVPDNWSQIPSPSSAVALVVASPRVAETGGNCNVALTLDATSRGKTQAEVDAEASTQINDQFWLAVLGSTRLFKSTTIDSSGDRMQRGRKVFTVKATSELASAPAKITQLLNMHPMPGQVFVTSCTARTEKFALEEADFDAILSSFDPSAELTVSLPHPGSFWGTVRPATARIAAPVVGRAIDAGVRHTISR